MRIFQEEIFGPVAGVTTFRDEKEAIEIAFGGYKQSGVGRETHKMMLEHYQQTKNVLVSHDPNPMGFY